MTKWKEALDKRLNPSYKDLRDVLAWFNRFKIAANDGWWGDGYIEDYRGKSKTEIETYAQRFAEENFNYQYKYDSTFRVGYDARVLAETTKQEAISGTLTDEQKTQIAQGVKDGVISGTKDYVLQYYDLAIGISNLNFDNLYEGVKNSWGHFTDPIGAVSSFAQGFIDEIKDILVKVETFTEYDYSKSTSYTVTQQALAIADPVGKIKNSTRIVEFGQNISKKVDDFSWVNKLSILSKTRLASGFDDYINHFESHKSEFDFSTATEYKNAALDFMKNKEGKDFIVWKRTYDRNGIKKDDIFKVNIKTGYLGVIDKYGNITTYHKSYDFLSNPKNYINNNKN